jgi:catechol 2,3-dioxygenase-like lactoylglutathione lyase family enzyme
MAIVARCTTPLLAAVHQITAISDTAPMIQHVAREIPAAEVGPCLGFYALLGFAPVPVPDGLAGRAVWLERTGTQIHLVLADDAEPDRGHIAVVVDAYDDTLQSLRDAGHQVEPRREHWGSPRAFVRDPVGHLVEVMAFAPGAAGPTQGSG